MPSRRRFQLSNLARHRYTSLYEWIVETAHREGLQGATVLEGFYGMRGPMGYGRHSRVHAAKFLEISFDLPIVIEIVDAEEKIDAFLPVVDEPVTEGLVTLARAPHTI